MREYEQSRALAQSLIAAAKGSGTVVEALITNMDRPLGIAAGNANEVIEAIDVLRGTAPEDLTDLTRAQGIRVLVMSRRFDEAQAEKALNDAVTSGAALEHCRRWIAAQGGDANVVDRPELLAQPRDVVEVKAPRSGYISAIDTYRAGMLAVDLGAGRRKHDDEIDFAAGIMFDRNAGDQVRSGDLIARIQLGAKQIDAGTIRDRYLEAVTITDAPPPRAPIVYELLKGNA
jgi:pyrimidine-nucleoside phosphorylase